ncbi:MAG: N-acetylmuramic acid 6-phosphate etherase [bacterium]
MEEEFITESPLQSSSSLDTLPVQEILRIMNREDTRPAEAVALELPRIEKAVAWILDAFKEGGRLFYIGAGTSGRLASLDAAECPPTFGTPPEMVQAVMAGGPLALTSAREGVEDDDEAAKKELREWNLAANDILVGISASGKTPFVRGGIRYAKGLGCKTVAITCNHGSPLTAEADLSIVLEVGPEVVTGSTRLKSGTAQKMVLNMLSTASLVKSGKTYGNLMVGLQPLSNKLKERSCRIIAQATSLGEEKAANILEQAQGDIKAALVMHFTGMSCSDSTDLLEKSGGSIRDAMSFLRERNKRRGNPIEDI